MVRDAYSADGQQPSNETESSNTHGQPLDLRGSSANLTQELAQLLAASIAQGQTGQRAGTPTGAELASLAALVLITAQRALAPSFRTGCHPSYSPPQRAPESPASIADIMTRAHADPGTWGTTSTSTTLVPPSPCCRSGSRCRVGFFAVWLWLRAGGDLRPSHRPPAASPRTTGQSRPRRETCRLQVSRL